MPTNHERLMAHHAAITEDQKYMAWINDIIVLASDYFETDRSDAQGIVDAFVMTDEADQLRKAFFAGQTPEEAFDLITLS